MKKLAIYCITLILAFTMFGLPNAQGKAEASTKIPIFVNGERVKFEVEPIQTEGTTLVQFTPIFQKLDLFFQWDGGTKTVTAVKENLKIELTAGKKQAIIDGRVSNLQVAPRIVKGKMFIPLRLVSEATGAGISIKNNTIFIVTGTTSNTSTSTTTSKTATANSNSAPSTIPAPTSEAVPSSKPASPASKVTADVILKELSGNNSQLMYDGIQYNVNYLVKIWDKDSVEITMLYDLEGIDHVLNANTKNRQASIYMTAPIAKALRDKYQYSNINVNQAYRGVYDRDPSGPGNDMMHDPVNVKYVGGKYVVTAVVYSTYYEYEKNKATLTFDINGGYPSVIDEITIP
ncbi:copper amine oxidase N-terminal domain-containing protein [Paenibacillus turicensis]|uniref:copper amine oxidase N-terminal domain-containing protein n=1 Tax=Paenibacillus turicensis TaxID=160487 RepID=UPI003D2776C5